MYMYIGSMWGLHGPHQIKTLHKTAVNNYDGDDNIDEDGDEWHHEWRR